MLLILILRILLMKVHLKVKPIGIPEYNPIVEVKFDPNPNIKDTVDAKITIDNLVKDEADNDTNGIINNNVSNGKVLKNTIN